MASIHVHDAVPSRVADDAIDRVLDELERLEAMFSTFRPSSQISRVNRGELDLLACDREVIEVLDACTWLEHASGGAFRVRRPDQPERIDPAGFVKGWAAERAARFLDDAGLEHWCVSVGGDLVTRGRPAPDEIWKVGIADPFQAGQAIARLDIVSGAVATSGTSERGLHIWDGRDGTAADDLVAVTVTGPTLAWADAFATTVFAMGAPGLGWLGAFDDYDAFVVHRDGSIVAGPGIVCSA
jgi:thiamine biosynthesis lipoprotein